MANEVMEWIKVFFSYRQIFLPESLTHCLTGTEETIKKGKPNIPNARRIRRRTLSSIGDPALDSNHEVPVDDLGLDSDHEIPVDNLALDSDHEVPVDSLPEVPVDDPVIRYLSLSLSNRVVASF
ncbi:hypothetical protein E2562_020715 [Oryza meyeriana var. granulata]|uniref:Uncharacterized protein n=1 Tax=Oryza meyeriana var. granulata TaxID=110450 RepID=A0A6G1EN32_9ORYZ|nr:hypothetical protein E2562_020715 [Oryza meyeriana var. granulata]